MPQTFGEHNRPGCRSARPHTERSAGVLACELRRRPAASSPVRTLSGMERNLFSVAKRRRRLASHKVAGRAVLEPCPERTSENSSFAEPSIRVNHEGATRRARASHFQLHESVRALFKVSVLKSPRHQRPPTRPEPTRMKLPNTPPLRNGELTAAFRNEGINPRRPRLHSRPRRFEEEDENERRNSFGVRCSMFPAQGELTPVL